MPESRRRIVGVGLKMYMGHRQSDEWMRSVADIAASHPGVAGGSVELFVLPSFVALVGARRIFEETAVGVGAQDLCTDDIGAFTGEVSGSELAEIGCSYVEVGHAERRNILGETDEVISRKTLAAFRNSLTPVLCVGEETESDPQSAAAACVAQLTSSLEASRERGVVGPVVLAYEPQWAIGAPRPADPEYIRSVCGRLRSALDEDPALAGSALIYGGSAGPGMLAALAGAVDGLFLGRSAHDPEALRAVLDEVAAFAP
ncbi:MAG: triose-phosphate isomerase family protein [Naasia sp.]